MENEHLKLDFTVLQLYYILLNGCKEEWVYNIMERSVEVHDYFLHGILLYQMSQQENSIVANGE